MRSGLHTVDIVAESDMDLANYDLEKTGHHNSSGISA